jgi:hypothetical protein
MKKLDMRKEHMKFEEFTDLVYIDSSHDQRDVLARNIRLKEIISNNYEEIGILIASLYNRSFIDSSGEVVAIDEGVGSDAIESLNRLLSGIEKA